MEVRFGEWTVSPVAGELRRCGELRAILSEREEQLLLLLVDRDPLPLTGRQITRHLLGAPAMDHQGYAKVLVARLRQRAGARIVVRTPRGYRLDGHA